MNEEEKKDLTDIPTSPTAKKGPTRLSRDALSYSAAATAALAMGGTADADIVYSGITNLVISATNATANTGMMNTVLLNIDGVGGNDFGIRVRAVNATFAPIVTQHQANASFFNAGIANGILDNAGAPPPIRNLNAGTSISAGASGTFNLNGRFGSATWQNNIAGPGSSRTGEFLNSVTAFAGIEFAQGANTHYGWLRIHVDLNISTNAAPFAQSRVTIIDWAWDDIPDNPIQAGATSMIPEPSSLGLLALGAAGVLANRKRRKKLQKS